MDGVRRAEAWGVEHEVRSEHAAFTVAEGRGAGLTQRRMRGRRYLRPFHGVRIDSTADLDTVRARAQALAVRLPDHACFSHATAASLHGMPLPGRLERPDRDLDVCVFAPARAPQLRGVRSHELKATGQQVVWIGGVRALGMEDAWVQLANEATVEELVVAADWLITGDEPYSSRKPPTSLEALDRAIARHGRMRGVRRLRQARDAARYGSLSPQETRLRLLLERSGMPRPELNHRVSDASGRLVAMVDLAYPEHRIAIEYLGDLHRTDKALYRSDIQRREALALAGWSTLFTTADDLADPSLFLLNLRRQLASTGKRPPLA